MTAKLDCTWKLREVMATRGLFQTNGAGGQLLQAR